MEGTNTRSSFSRSCFPRFILKCVRDKKKRKIKTRNSDAKTAEKRDEEAPAFEKKKRLTLGFVEAPARIDVSIGNNCRWLFKSP